jgi:hypothetical protein
MQKEKPEKEFNQNVFFDFEEKYDLFNKHFGNLFYWDLIRFELFYQLLWSRNSNVKSEKTLTSKKQILKELRSFFKFFLIQKVDFLFFTASRNKINDDTIFDQNLADIMEVIPGSYYAFESFERDKTKWLYKNTLFNPIAIFRRIIKFFYKHKSDYSELISLINNEFPRSAFTIEDVNRIILDYKIDYFYYSILFKIKKPKAVFITQNGIQKGLFAAGKRYNIPIVEVQHGIIDDAHLAYSYSKKNNYKENQLYLPTYFFSFSEFWTKDLNFPVKEIIAMGNSYFYNTQINNKKGAKDKKGLLVASSDVFGEDLKNIILDFVNINKTIPVYFKLHPNQFSEKKYYLDQFVNNDNVKVYTNENSIYELLEISNAILVIQSTALYEAYHLKKKGFIYKKQTFQRHQHVFDLPNIFLIDNANEITEVFSTDFIFDEMSKNLFFKNFDSLKFNQFVINLNL